MGAPAAGLRLLLRQAPLRSPRARGRRGGARAPDRGSGVPAQAPAVRREPRRAPGCGDVPAREGARRRGRDADPGRRPPGARGPARGADGARAGLPRPPSERGARRGPARVLRAPARRAPRPRLPHRRVAARRRSGWEGNDAWRSLVAWGWRDDGPRKLVVVNLGDAPSSGHVSLPWDDLRGRSWRLEDGATGEVYERSGDDLRDGLYVALDPWGWHLFDLDTARGVIAMPNAATAEHAAPRRGDGPRRGRPLQRQPVVRVGPVPERASVGHGPRGLLARAATPGPRSRTTTPARARTAGTRTAWPGSPTSATSSASRSRSGTGRTRSSRSGCSASPAPGEPRRGRQGVLVVPRGAAEPRAAEVALPLPAGRSSRTSALVHHGRGLHDPELELLDTGVFDDDRYWSVDVTYAKASPTEVLMRIELENHGPDEATLHVLPTLWFRNTWSWAGRSSVPRLEGDGQRSAWSDDHRLAGYRLEAAPGARRCGARGALLRERVERAARVRVGGPTTPYPKDGINDHVVSGAPTVNPEGVRHEGRAALRRDRARRRHGRAAAAGCPPPATAAAPGLGRRGVRRGHRRARGRRGRVLRRRSRPTGPTRSRCASCARPAPASSGASRCTRTTCRRWLDGDSGRGAAARVPRLHGRNSDWRHLDSFDVLAMPDPWEYPWFAAWDLGFHCVPWAHLDPAFAKYQVLVLLREWFQHPNGALPAYEWNFDDINPPVHVMAALRVFVHRRRPRPRVPRARLPEAARQLHVVGQPRGRRRQQRLQRRLPRARQHQPDRPLEPPRGRSRSSRPTARHGWPTTRCRCW